MLRYRESGELHLDFHGGTNGAIEFITERYGRAGLREILRETAHKVYRSIYEKLKAGDLSELAEHWQYFMEREGAEFELEVTPDELVLTVHQCPAVRHLHKLGIPPSPHFCDQTILLNEAWCEDTPFQASTQITGDGSCVQKITLAPDNTTQEVSANDTK